MVIVDMLKAAGIILFVCAALFLTPFLGFIFGLICTGVIIAFLFFLAVAYFKDERESKVEA